jgi:hypothetical protein
MAKKKILKKIEKDFIPEDDRQWLMQPITMTMMRYDYNVVQNRILVALLSKLQAALKAIVYGHQTPESQMFILSNKDYETQFPDSSIHPGDVVFRIPFSQIMIDKHHYAQLRESLSQLAFIPVEIPLKSVDGIDYTKYTCFCQAVIPNEGKGTDAYIKIEYDVATKIIRNDMGNHQFLQQVLFESRNKYAQRIYLLLSAWRQSNMTCIRTVPWLRKWLRLEKKYPRWNSFAERVLKSAEDELKEMAEAGKSDIYFTYQKIYDGNSRAGEPDKIKFIIHRVGVNEMLEQKKEKVIALCYERFGIKNIDSALIIKRLDENSIDEFIAYISELDELEKRLVGAGKVNQLDRHAFTCMMRKLDEIDGSVTDALKENESVKDSADDGVGETVAKAEVPDVNYDKWAVVMDELKEKILPIDYNTWFANGTMRYGSFVDGKLEVLVPTQVFLELLSNLECYTVFCDMVKHEFGEDVNITYKVRG